MSEEMIDINKKYETRDGREVTQLTRFTHNNGETISGYPLIGVVGDEYVVHWGDDGVSLCLMDKLDLVLLQDKKG